ncbi:MAG TPA: DUF1254 domain-containing protein [Candidatus Sulfotelmatobacter sp.]|nr:DUF1254 domain-containing protein [Candidatus Sulfotelmatobacter sp.]
MTHIVTHPATERARLLPKLLAICSLLLATGTSGPAAAEDAALRRLADVAERAYVYGFPLYEMYRIRYGALYDTKRVWHQVPNHFVHVRALAGPQSRAVTAPNNDTLYSSAWLDLATEPLVVHVPDTAGRYYSLAFMDFYTNNFAYIGRRATGTKAGDYVVAGPGWQGRLPPGLPVIRAPTPAVWLLGRTLVDGADDLAAAHAVQDGYRITPLSTWRKEPGPDKPAGAAPLAPDPGDPWNFFRIVDLALTENPPPPRDAAALRDFAAIGIGPGLHFDTAKFSAAELQALRQGMDEAADGLKRAGSIRSKGWNRPPADLGNYGTDYNLRAVVALVGLAALEPVEAMYLGADTDSSGRTLDGREHYHIHFSAGGLPPCDAFWSLTLYEIDADKRAFLAANPIDRYSIGDRTKGLVYDEHGALEIVIAHHPPAGARRANWLPAPDGPFRLSLRCYQPKPALLQGRYHLPDIVRG